MKARDKLVFSTIDLVRRHGVAGTGVAEILERGSVSRRSIYLNFPDGKTGLVAEATRVAGNFIHRRIEQLVEMFTPQETLTEFIADWKTVVTDSDFDAGCPIAAAAVSRSSVPAVSDLAGDALDSWQATITASLMRHGLCEVTSRTFANTAIAAVEGAVMMCVAQKSTSALDDVETQLNILLTHHLDGIRGPQ
ncbi:MAG: TetR/AcrR family transcriptional regulator [Rhodococcus sp. (in: high G+C Gram-positive bacteria)]